MMSALLFWKLKKFPNVCLLSGGILKDLKGLAHPGTSIEQLLSAASGILPSSFSGSGHDDWPAIRLVHRASAEGELQL
jgi:hypothetical protein